MTDQNVTQRFTALYHTFGCKLNFAETSTIASMLADKGVTRVTGVEHPDVILINSCSVTELAEKKCRQMIRSLARKHPGAAIAVTGCYAQLSGEKLRELPGVKIVAGNDRKTELVDYIMSYLDNRNTNSSFHLTPTRDIRTFTPSCSRGDRTRYFLKVQDGCDYYCTYCTIPFARGRSRSPMIDDLIAQAETVAAEGGKEIVLTGVNIGDFGKGRDDRFIDLCRCLDQVEGIERYRISSIEPNLLTDELIDFVATSKRFMPHFHIPLQCGSDEVLRLMHRRYDTALFRHKIEKVRQTLPDAFIGVDVIVGSRGETPELFAEAKRFMESIDFSRLHVFTYSERPGTKALEIDNVVSQEEKHHRTSEVIALSDKKLASFMARYEGTIRPVLLEHPAADGSMGGFTDNYLRVNIATPRPELANTIVNCRLTTTDAPEGEMRGEVMG
ncbi:MAG: tRNA (N(6)-L-threonylcarbamoyladenosine(37)-C(2))-methylthiotransferase MtaB [Lachnoclostridium sp.]|nr:tRNA (N(6)-L-threonylcarbamoyladenosine(37)-C(2))-methylthiotransferase MtaB [Lachnoclostridium sp.]